jgi:peptide/nickel transport system ATP-binding protein
VTSAPESIPGGEPGSELLLEVENLVVQFPTPDGVVKAVDGLTFTVSRGETLGIVGESGSGKSVTSLALLGLLNPKRSQISGEAKLKGVDLLTASPERLRKIRGKEIAMIFQDPFACLHPMYKVGDQLVEAVRVHEDIPKEKAMERAIETLAAVGIPNPRGRARDYPHQYSGGMRQRAMIAMGLINNPEVLIADEPTTALDVTVQAQILDLIDRVKTEFKIGVILITHDLGVVAEVAQTVMVMYAGRAVEHGAKEDVFRRPLHPYTWGLLESIPTVTRREAKLIPIEGSPPSLIRVPPGCAFHPRCPHRFDPCDKERPDLIDRGGGHPDACHLTADEKRRLWEERERRRLGSAA